jgi:Cu/Zn superoxide dismutase
VDTSARAAGAEERVVMTAQFEPGEGTKAGQNINGSVSVFEGSEVGGDYKLAVRIEGLTEGEHAWHIHSAPCGKEAPVVVAFTDTNDAPGLAQPLIPGESRVAEATVTVPKDKLSLDELRKGEFSLHVHERGGVDHGRTMACANR